LLIIISESAKLNQQKVKLILMEAIKQAAPLEKQLFDEMRAKYTLKQIFEYNEVTQSIYNVHCNTEDKDVSNIFTQSSWTELPGNSSTTWRTSQANTTEKT